MKKLPHHLILIYLLVTPGISQVSLDSIMSNTLPILENIRIEIVSNVAYDMIAGVSRQCLCRWL